MVDIYLVLYFAAYGVLLPLLIVIHETGHYIFARLAGIPAEHIKISLSFPPHVAIKSWSGKWVTTKNFQNYIREFKNFVPRERFLYYFLAGGLLLETDFLLLAVLGVYLFPISNSYIFVLVFLSLFVNLVYMIVDMVQSFKTKEPAGDISTMWLLDTKKTIIILILFFAVRLSIIYIYFTYLQLPG
ncbi:MAG: hypothetical protein ACOC1S_01405 [bacterium]